MSATIHCGHGETWTLRDWYLHAALTGCSSWIVGDRLVTWWIQRRTSRQAASMVAKPASEADSTHD